MKVYGVYRCWTYDGGSIHGNLFLEIEKAKESADSLMKQMQDDDLWTGAENVAFIKEEVDFSTHYFTCEDCCIYVVEFEVI